MKDMTQFMDRLLAAAQQAGIDPAEVYYAQGQDFTVSAKNREIDDYSVSDSCGLGLRGTYRGKMGYASTQAMDELAISQLIEGVIDSASLVEAADQDEIFPGADQYPVIEAPQSDLEHVSAEEKIKAVLQLESSALCDPRIAQIEGAYVGTSSYGVRMKNTFGMDLSHTDCSFFASVVPVAREGEDTSVVDKAFFGRKFSDFSPEGLGREAAAETIRALHGRSVPAGIYPVVLRWEAMKALLSVFSSVFSAERAQKKLSKLLGREGETIAAPCVTIVDDPLLPGGASSRHFDGEGVPTRTKLVVQDGVLKTLLHNRKTAKKQGVETTGNANRGGYAGVLSVSPTNLYLQPGTHTLEELLAQMGDGLLIYELSGLHAGANPVSGDFSLICKGFRVENGQVAAPVEQITVAGNFYQLLEGICKVGSDLTFLGGSIGSPSVFVEKMSVSGAG